MLQRSKGVQGAGLAGARLEACGSYGWELGRGGELKRKGKDMVDKNPWGMNMSREN